MKITSSRHAAVWVGLTALWGCGPAGDAVPAGSSDALSAPDRTVAPATRLRYTVGALEGASWETFGRISSVAFDGAGNLYVLDGDAASIVVIDSDGEYVRTISRKGDGPGELDNPFGMVVLRDGRTAVFDFSKLGFQLFGPDGEFLESVTFDPQEGLPSGGMIATPDGRVLTAGAIRFSMGGELPERSEGRPIERFGLDGSHDVAYRAWAPPRAEEGDATELANEEGNRMRFQMDRMRAFTPPLHVAPLSDGRFLVTDSVGYRIKIVGPDGAVEGMLERPIEPTPVTDEIEEMERQRQLDVIHGRAEGGGNVTMTVVGGSRSGGGGSVSFDQDQIRRMMEERVEDMVFFPEIPVIARLAVDDVDRIWVERAGELPGEPGPTDLLTPDGRYLGTIPADGLRIPDAFGPGGLMAYIETDELDVPRVRVIELQDGEPLETRP